MPFTPFPFESFFHVHVHCPRCSLVEPMTLFQFREVHVPDVHESGPYDCAYCFGKFKWNSGTVDAPATVRHRRECFEKFAKLHCEVVPMNLEDECPMCEFADDELELPVTNDYEEGLASWEFESAINELLMYAEGSKNCLVEFLKLQQKLNRVSELLNADRDVRKDGPVETRRLENEMKRLENETKRLEEAEECLKKEEKYLERETRQLKEEGKLLEKKRKRLENVRNELEKEISKAETKMEKKFFHEV